MRDYWSEFLTQLAKAIFTGPSYLRYCFTILLLSSMGLFLYFFFHSSGTGFSFKGAPGIIRTASFWARAAFCSLALSFTLFLLLIVFYADKAARRDIELAARQQEVDRRIVESQRRWDVIDKMSQDAACKYLFPLIKNKTNDEQKFIIETFALANGSLEVLQFHHDMLGVYIDDPPRRELLVPLRETVEYANSRDEIDPRLSQVLPHPELLYMGHAGKTKVHHRYYALLGELIEYLRSNDYVTTDEMRNRLYQESHND